jgi:nucleoside-diphosphate-sugar epimerase
VATLLTGAGYIGAALLRRLKQEQAPSSGPVVVLENFFSTSPDAGRAALPPGMTLIEGDVAEPADVARAFDALGPPSEPAVVFHLAAQPSAAIAVRDPQVTERSNLVGARVVLEAARERGARVVFGGSFRVYGDDLVGAHVDEDTPYGRVGDLSHLSKVYVEQLARMLGVSFVSVRLGVTYGLSPIMKATPAFMTVPNLFCQRAGSGETLHVLEDRPMAFIHVDDAASALLAAARVETRGWQALNAAPEVATIGEVARTVQRLMQQRGKQARVQGETASEATFQVRSRLAFQPRHALATGLGDVLDYFLQLTRR